MRKEHQGYALLGGGGGDLGRFQESRLLDQVHINNKVGEVSKPGFTASHVLWQVDLGCCGTHIMIGH